MVPFLVVVVYYQTINHYSTKNTKSKSCIKERKHVIPIINVVVVVVVVCIAVIVAAVQCSLVAEIPWSIRRSLQIACNCKLFKHHACMNMHVCYVSSRRIDFNARVSVFVAITALGLLLLNKGNLAVHMPL